MNNTNQKVNQNNETVERNDIQSNFVLSHLTLSLTRANIFNGSICLFISTMVACKQSEACEISVFFPHLESSFAELFQERSTKPFWERLRKIFWERSGNIFSFSPDLNFFCLFVDVTCVGFLDGVLSKKSDGGRSFSFFIVSIFALPQHSRVLTCNLVTKKLSTIGWWVACGSLLLHSIWSMCEHAHFFPAELHFCSDDKKSSEAEVVGVPRWVSFHCCWLLAFLFLLGDFPFLHCPRSRLQLSLGGNASGNKFFNNWVVLWVVLEQRSIGQITSEFLSNSKWSEIFFTKMLHTWHGPAIRFFAETTPFPKEWSNTQRGRWQTTDPQNKQLFMTGHFAGGIQAPSKVMTTLVSQSSWLIVNGWASMKGTAFSLAFCNGNLRQLTPKVKSFTSSVSLLCFAQLLWMHSLLICNFAPPDWMCLRDNVSWDFVSSWTWATLWNRQSTRWPLSVVATAAMVCSSTFVLLPTNPPKTVTSGRFLSILFVGTMWLFPQTNTSRYFFVNGGEEWKICFANPWVVSVQIITSLWTWCVFWIDPADGLSQFRVEFGGSFPVVSGFCIGIDFPSGHAPPTAHPILALGYHIHGTRCNGGLAEVVWCWSEFAQNRRHLHLQLVFLHCSEMCVCMFAIARHGKKEHPGIGLLQCWNEIFHFGVKLADAWAWAFFVIGCCDVFVAPVCCTKRKSFLVERQVWPHQTVSILFWKCALEQKTSVAQGCDVAKTHQSDCFWVVGQSCLTLFGFCLNKILLILLQLFQCSLVQFSLQCNVWIVVVLLAELNTTLKIINRHATLPLWNFFWKCTKMQKQLILCENHAGLVGENKKVENPFHAQTKSVLEKMKLFFPPECTHSTVTKIQILFLHIHQPFFNRMCSLFKARCHNQNARKRRFSFSTPAFNSSHDQKKI